MEFRNASLFRVVCLFVFVSCYRGEEGENCVFCYFCPNNNDVMECQVWPRRNTKLSMKWSIKMRIDTTSTSFMCSHLHMSRWGHSVMICPSKLNKLEWKFDYFQHLCSFRGGPLIKCCFLIKSNSLWCSRSCSVNEENGLTLCNVDNYFGHFLGDIIIAGQRVSKPTVKISQAWNIWLFCIVLGEVCKCCQLHHYKAEKTGPRWDWKRSMLPKLWWELWWKHQGDTAQLDCRDASIRHSELVREVCLIDAGKERVDRWKRRDDISVKITAASAAFMNEALIVGEGGNITSCCSRWWAQPSQSTYESSSAISDHSFDLICTNCCCPVPTILSLLITMCALVSNGTEVPGSSLSLSLSRFSSFLSQHKDKYWGVYYI